MGPVGVRATDDALAFAFEIGGALAVKLGQLAGLGVMHGFFAFFVQRLQERQRQAALVRGDDLRRRKIDRPAALAHSCDDGCERRPRLLQRQDVVEGKRRGHDRLSCFKRRQTGQA